jgi:hypothetical protein
VASKLRCAELLPSGTQIGILLKNTPLDDSPRWDVAEVSLSELMVGNRWRRRIAYIAPRSLLPAVGPSTLNGRADQSTAGTEHPRAARRHPRHPTLLCVCLVCMGGWRSDLLCTHVVWGPPPLPDCTPLQFQAQNLKKNAEGQPPCLQWEDDGAMAEGWH